MKRESNYNFMLDAGDDYLLLYNSRTGAFVALPSDITGDVKRLLREPKATTESDGTLLEQLVHGGFLIDENFDEVQAIRKRYENYKNNDGKMILTMLASETCNFNCPYCFVYERRGFNMRPWVYGAVLEYIKKNATAGLQLKVNWFGGEPTLAHKNIVEFMAQVNNIAKAQKFDKILSSMVTNGYLLSKQKLETYVGLGIDMFQVTLDGNAETHDKTRHLVNGRGTFETIWKNLESIKETPARFDMAIRVNFLKGMDESIQAVIRRFRDSFGGDDRFRIYFRPVYNFKTSREDICTLQDDIYSLEEGVYRQMDYNLNVAEATGTLQTNCLLSNPVPQPIPAWCDTERTKFWVVGADGKLFKCDSYIGNKDKAVAELTADGEIHHYPGAYNWNRNFYSDAFSEKCQTCKLLPICQGGCPRLRKERGDVCCYLDEKQLKAALLKTHQFNSRKSAALVTSAPGKAFGTN